MEKGVPDVLEKAVDALPHRCAAFNSSTIDLKYNSKLSNVWATILLSLERWSATLSLIKRPSPSTKLEPEDDFIGFSCDKSHQTSRRVLKSLTGPCQRGTNTESCGASHPDSSANYYGQKVVLHLKITLLTDCSDFVSKFFAFRVNCTASSCKDNSTGVSNWAFDLLPPQAPRQQDRLLLPR